MSIDEFRQSLTNPQPPANLPKPLLALWHEAKGDWAGAHEILQNDDSLNGAWVHAYLHRVEGDAGNAAYWYRRAGKPFPKTSLQQEWNDIVSDLLSTQLN